MRPMTMNETNSTTAQPRPVAALNADETPAAAPAMSADEAQREHVEATRRVSAYFRSLGVTDADLVARHAERIMQRFEAEHPRTHGKDLAAAAVDEARRALRDWLLRLVELGHMPQPQAMTTGMIIWRLRKALLKHPDAFLATEHLPAGFVADVSVAPPAILPAPLLGQMEARSFEWRAFGLPPAVTQPLHRLNAATATLVMSVVAGR